MKTFIKIIAFTGLIIACFVLQGAFDCNAVFGALHDTLSIDNLTVAGSAVIGIGAFRDRAIFKGLRNQFPGTVPQPGSYLRIEQVLSNSSGKYEFRLKKTNTEKIQEVKLEQNDIFVITDLAVYLLKADTTKEGKDVLQTFVNQQVFPAVTGFTPGHLEAIYNGKLSLKVGQINHIENLSMQYFRNVPETQQSAGTNLSEYDIKNAVYPLGSNLNLRGNDDVIVTIEFPTFTGMQIAAVAANTEHRIVFHPYGYLMRNAAK